MNIPEKNTSSIKSYMRSVIVLIVLQLVIAVSAAHCTYLLQYSDNPSISVHQRHAAFTKYYVMLLLYSALIVLGLPLINKKWIYYINFILFPITATAGVMVALANKWIEGGFDDLRWFLTIILLFIMVLATTGLVKLLLFITCKLRKKPVDHEETK
jgi:cytochrome bd-type quinol oxidase subunit 2